MRRLVNQHWSAIAAALPSLALLLACRAAPAKEPREGAAMFLGDARHSGDYTAVAAPAGAGLSMVCWRANTGGMVRSSPAATRDLVVVGSGDGGVYAFDRATGVRRWRADAGDAVDGSPAVNDAMAYATTRRGIVLALHTSSGAEAWRHAMGPSLPMPWGREGWDYIASSPTLVGDVVLVSGMDGVLAALDANSGRERWRFSLGSPARSSPAAADGLVYVGAADGRLTAVDLATGALKWRFDTEGARLNSAQFGFDRKTIQASPTVSDGFVIVGSRDGRIYGVDAATGKERWRASVEPSWVVGSAAVRNGLAYVTTSDARVIDALDVRTGQRRWRVNAGDRMFASPSIIGDAVYIPTHGRQLLALDAQTGAERWRLPLDGPATSSAAARDGALYLGTDAGTVYAIHPAAHGAPVPAVFWDSALAPQSVLAGGTALRDELEAQGYRVLDAAALRDFVTGEIASHARSVVVFAQDVMPTSVAAPTKDSVLLQRYLAAGGKVVWFADPPLALGRDSSGHVRFDKYGYPVDYSVARAVQLLGVSYKGGDASDYPAQPTAAGRRWGITQWSRATWAIDTAQVSEVLALTPAGKAAAWVRSYGGPPGSGFVQLWGDEAIPLNRIDDIKAATEYGVSLATNSRQCVKGGGE